MVSNASYSGFSVTLASEETPPSNMVQPPAFVREASPFATSEAVASALRLFARAARSAGDSSLKASLGFSLDAFASAARADSAAARVASDAACAAAAAARSCSNSARARFSAAFFSSDARALLLSPNKRTPGMYSSTSLVCITRSCSAARSLPISMSAGRTPDERVAREKTLASRTRFQSGVCFFESEPPPKSAKASDTCSRVFSFPFVIVVSFTHRNTASSTVRACIAPKKSRLLCFGNARVSFSASSRENPGKSEKTLATTSTSSSAFGAQRNLSMRPSLSKGAYSVDRSFPVTTIGTRRSGFSLARYVSEPTQTRSGWSQMFIKVPTTICELTVFCV
mmetsp:Transcript_13188/g.55405  ORF Transcript_13188/g.55405 Transcript_13188/m.55405 type:complete len:340 (+) Transcript_13188:97-1116(+)